MRTVLLLLLASFSIARAVHWYAWTQATDADSEWGFHGFYPKALTINPGDSITFTQNYEKGIIALFATGTSAPSMYYTAGPDPCDASYACRTASR